MRDISCAGTASAVSRFTLVVPSPTLLLLLLLLLALMTGVVVVVVVDGILLLRAVVWELR